MRITAACPESLVYAGNQLAMCLAFSEADGQTYVGLNWKDVAGNLYSAASFEVSDNWVVFAQSPLVRPSWDYENIIDMDAASKAQSAMIFSTEPVIAIPTVITAIGGMDGVDAMLAMGLMPVEDF